MSNHIAEPPCICSEAGWCPRFRTHMGQYKWGQCQKDPGKRRYYAIKYGSHNTHLSDPSAEVGTAGNGSPRGRGAVQVRVVGGKRRKRSTPGVAHRVQRLKVVQHVLCTHLDQEARLDLSCSCKAYVCALHDIAILSGSNSAGTPCWSCKDYTQPVVRPPYRCLDIPVAITTAPLIRRGEVAGHRECLPRTLDSLLSAGWRQDEVTIYAEPQSLVPEGWPTVWRERRLGPWHNFYKALGQQVGAHPDADAYLFLEDDTWLSPGAREHFNRWGWPSPHCGLIRVFRMSGKRHGGIWVSADSITGELREDGYQQLLPRQYLWGSNALLIHPQAARLLLRDRNIPRGYNNSPDIRLGLLMPRYKLEEWCCNPSLAQTDSSLPSAIGHRVTKRMESDTYQEAQQDGLVSVVVPGYHCPDLTVQCVQALQGASALVGQVIYVDNGSDQEEWQEVRAALQGSGLPFSVVRNPTNLGFTAAVNQGIELASCQYLLLLNNDCYLSQDCLGELVQALEADQRLGCVVPLTTGERWGVSSVLGARHGARCKGLRELVSTPVVLQEELRRRFRVGEVWEADYVPFFCALVRARVVEEVGLLSPKFVNGLGADNEWCSRARRVGWRCAVVPRAFALHDHHATFERYGIKRRVGARVPE